MATPPPQLARALRGRGGTVRRSLSSPLGLAAVGTTALLAATASTRDLGVGLDRDRDRGGGKPPRLLGSRRRALREYVGYDPSDAADHVARRYAHLAMPEWLIEASEISDPRRREAELKESFHEAWEEFESSRPPPGSGVEPYTLADVMSTSDNFSSRMGILIYDPENDRFLFLSPSGVSNRGGGGAKTIQSFRFQGPASDELATAIGSGDYVHLSEACYKSFLHPDAEGGCEVRRAPVLQFGSVYRDDEILPNTVGEFARIPDPR
ncbi:hypothetical protein ACHAWF_014469 [Thalassiosira exigua]